MKAPFTWSDEAHEVVSRMCVSRWGIRFRPGDTHRLRDVAECAYLASNDSDVGHFFERMRALPDDDPEMQAFVSQLVIGETSFFRYRPQFEALRSTILPALIAERRHQRRHVLRIWSAGCSSGEEPYSAAMLVSDLIPDWRDWDIQIFGTDINPYALRRARLARFGDWSFRGVDDVTIASYFRQVGARTRFLVHPCRELVKFFLHNLATDPVPDREHGLSDLDVILCRNVTIYFDESLTQTLADGFRSALTPGGWLLVGHAEPDPAVFSRFEPVEFEETLVYRAPGGAASGEIPARPAPTPRTPIAEPAIPTLVDRSAKGPDPKLPTLVEARAAYDAHDHVGAAELLAAIASRPGADPTATHLLAQLSADEKRYDEALYWAFRTLLIDRFHAPTLMLMALIWLERGEPTHARELLQHAIFNNPRAPEAHLYLSMAHRALANPDQAERSRDRAVRLARAHADEWKGTDLLPVERPRIGLAED